MQNNACPKSCAVAMALVKSIFKPRYFAIVWLIDSTYVTCSILVQIWSFSGEKNT